MNILEKINNGRQLNQMKTYKKVYSVKIPALDRMLEEMKRDPWHVKFRRWLRVEWWVLICRTRFIWDLEYQHNIFKKKHNEN